MSRRDQINPLDLVPTEDLSLKALELLKAGDTGDEFRASAHHLTLCVGERQAVMEGTLLGLAPGVGLMAPASGRTSQLWA